MTFEEGLKLVKAGRLEEGLNVLKTVVASEDQNHKAWNALGVTLTKKGDYDEAARCFERAIALKPDEQVYLKNKRINNEKSSSHSPPPKQNSSKLLNSKGVIWILGGFFILLIILGSIVLLVSMPGMEGTKKAEGGEEGILAQQISSVLDPSEKKAEEKSTEGFEYLKQGDPDVALNTFEEAINLSPENPRAWTGKGFSQIDRGEYEEAVQSFDVALRYNASYYNAQSGRQIANEALGRS